MGLGVYFALFLFFLYIPMILMAILSFQGPTGQLTFPFRGPFSLDWWKTLFDTNVFNTIADDVSASGRQSLWLSLAAGVVVAVLGFTLSMAFRRRWRFKTDVVAFYVLMLALMTPGFLLGLGTQLLWTLHGRDAEPLEDGARRERDLGDPVRLPRHARGLEPLRPPHRGGGARPRRERGHARSAR